MFITWTISEKSGLGDVGASFLWIYIKNLEALEKLPFLGTLSTIYKIYKNYIDLYKKPYKYHKNKLLNFLNSHIMEQKSQKLLKCKTKSNKKAEFNKNLPPGTALKTSVNFRIKKKNQHDPAKILEKRRNLTFYIKRINQMIKHCHKVQ